MSKPISSRIDTSQVIDALNALAKATPSEIDATLWACTRVAEWSMGTIENLERRISMGMEGLGDKLIAAWGDRTQALRDIKVLDQVFHLRGGWTRAWKVVSSNGHVHRSMSCTTCFDTTQFIPLPQVSDLSEEEIVSLAGEAACTVCYPSAPVDTRNKPCMLFTQEEIEARDAKQAEKVARIAAKAAKAIANPDGTPLRVHSVCGVIETEVTAQRTYVELTVDATSGYYERGAKGYGEEAETILVALAHKRGTSVEEQRYLLADKVVAKAKRDDCPKAAAIAKQVKTHYLQKAALKDQA